jgi:catechol 2,3-dioxygenase-like lactoylglutathione lyase family enzyme
MTIQFDHTIVPARDKRAGAEFLAGILGLEVSAPFGPFVPVETANGVKLDFIDAEPDQIESRHYAFLVSDEDFDAIFARINDAQIDYYADPYHEKAGEINRRDGGRGFYFADPDGHNLEVITRPYGSGGE